MIKDRSHGAVSAKVVDELLRIVGNIRDGALRTAAHCDQVAEHAVSIAERLGAGAEVVARVRHAAALHDIGKAVVPAEILLKPDALTPDERREIERHAAAGAQMLERAGLIDEARVVRSHHERFDGAGYPDGLAGEDIPLEARIIFVADSFDAMTTDRPYRRACSAGDAVAELRRCAGTQFDPAVVDVMAELVAA